MIEGQRKLLYVTLMILLISCKKENSLPPAPAWDQSVKSGQTDAYYESYSGNNSDGTYHTDSNYKYEYRTGTSGDYEYNYDVNGSDWDGNGVSGNVDMDGKYGSGTIEDENGNSVDVDVEWIGKGQLEATDGDGNTYDLEVD